MCHLLGDFMETVKKDFTKAATIYKTNCDDYQFGRSCHKYAGYSFVGKGCQADQERSYDYFKRGCQLGEADSCLNAGLMCVSKNEKNKIKTDYKGGLEFLKDACSKGNAFGCYYVSGMYISGVPDFMEKDMTQAHGFASRACELNEMYSCANLSRMYARGEGVEKDEQLADKFKLKAMDLQQQVKANQQIRMQQGAA